MSTPFHAPIAQEIWDMKYRFKEADGTSIDQTVSDTWWRIANALAAVENEDRRSEWAADFYSALEDFKFLPAGRITAGAGTDRSVTLFNCYVMGTIPDSMEGIFENLKEASLTMQQGGGIGYDFSTIRPKGALVKGVAADASGPLTFMDCWDAMCRTVMSAGSRRGAMMATMRCDHPDIEDFITAKQDAARLRMFNMSVLVTGDFMDAVKNGERWALKHKEPCADRDFGEPDENGLYTHRYVMACDLWDQIMRSTYDYAEPGVIFIDKINNDNNLRAIETIAATNPCFTGDQMIWTAHGPKRFADVEGQRVLALTENVAGKLVYRPMDVFKTAEDQELVRVTLDDGTVVECTPKHEFFDLERNRVEAQHLEPGQRLASVYRHNANSKGYKRLTNGIDNPLEHHVPFEIVPDGFHVHHINEVKDDNRPENLELIGASEHNAMHMRGERNPSITHPENNKLIQQDHSGANNGRYRGDIDDEQLQELRKQGMSYAAIAKAVGCSKYTAMTRLGYERPNHKVVSVERMSHTADVYCGTVEETHKFFLSCERGAVLVSNCGEQPLPPYGACLLGSLNLTKFVVDPFGECPRIDSVELKRVVALAVRMMDNVNDVSNFPLEAQAKESAAKRRIGLGVTGLADMLVMCGLTYGTDEAGAFANQLMHDITTAAYETSVELAKEKGAFPAFDAEQFLADGTFASRLPTRLRAKIKEHGIRNSHLTSIAPTGTISLYAGNVSSGIEPIFALSYDRKVLQPDGTKTTQTVEDYAVAAWMENGGLEELPHYFVTAQDLPPEAHLVMQAALQPWIDSSISKTINLPEDISFEDFKSVYQQAYDLGCKGCTTYRPNDVTGSVISVSDDTPPDEVTWDADGVAQRPDELLGSTYKIKYGGHAIYITMNDAVVGGQRRPFEIFVNSKNMEHYAWIVGLTRMISAVFRRGGDVQFVADELKNVFDPRGGEWVKGKYVPSVLAAIGQVVELHMQQIGYTEVGQLGVAPVGNTPVAESAPGEPCANCGSFNTKNENGCAACLDCGHSKCG